jgi:hypothetical protein
MSFKALNKNSKRESLPFKVRNKKIRIEGFPPTLALCLLGTVVIVLAELF